jgi:hypothetical protein
MKTTKIPCSFDFSSIAVVFRRLLILISYIIGHVVIILLTKKNNFSDKLTVKMQKKETNKNKIVHKIC